MYNFAKNKNTDIELDSKGVVGHKFIKSRRVSGYSIESALGELFDNPQDQIVSATKITAHFHLEKSSINKLQCKKILVLDNGSGMDYDTLRNCHSLGSSRVYSQKCLGRFGEGGILGSLSIASRRKTYTRSESGVLLARGYDMDLVKEQDTWGSFPIEVTPEDEKWFSDLVGETGTIVVLESLDLMRPITWQSVKTRLLDYLPTTYDKWLSEDPTGREISFKSFVNDKCQDYKIVKPVDPLYWYHDKNQQLRDELINHEYDDGTKTKVRVRVSYIKGIKEVKRGDRNKTQGGYVYRNGRIIISGTRLIHMGESHNDYRNLRYSIEYDASGDAAMGTSPSKNGIHMDQSLHDKILHFVQEARAYIAHDLRKDKDEKNKEQADGILKKVAENLGNSEPATRGRKSKAPNKKSEKVTILRQPAKKDYNLIQVSHHRNGSIGECIMSTSSEFRYDLTINRDHPAVQEIFEQDSNVQELCFNLLLTTLNAASVISCGTEEESRLLRDNFVNTFSNSLRNLTTIS